MGRESLGIPLISSSSHKVQRSLGLTLVEVLFSLGLLGLTIALLGRLAISYQGIIAFSDGTSMTTAATQALEAIAREISGASEVLSPEVGADATSILTVDILDHRSKQRFEPDNWTPRRALDTVRLSYSLEGESLVRTALFPRTGSRLQKPVARGLAGFAVSRPNDRRIELSASIQESRLVRVVRVTAYRWSD